MMSREPLNQASKATTWITGLRNQTRVPMNFAFFSTTASIGYQLKFNTLLNKHNRYQHVSHRREGNWKTLRCSKNSKMSKIYTDDNSLKFLQNIGTSFRFRKLKWFLFSPIPSRGEINFVMIKMVLTLIINISCFRVLCLLAEWAYTTQYPIWHVTHFSAKVD